jgi:pantothenate kinase type III
LEFSAFEMSAFEMTRAPAGSERRVWTLDVGNSRGKLRRWCAPSSQGAGPISDGARGAWRLETAPGSSLGALAPGEEWPLGELLAGLTRALDAEPQLGGVHAAFSCVASPSLEQSVAQLFRAKLSARALGTPGSGLENRCDPPESVGRDRLFAARGALERLGRSALVVDLGSAITVDLLRVENTAGAARLRGLFCGGSIAPGPALLASALHRLTARLPAVDVRPPVTALGRDTQGAISSGVFHGVRGAVRELVERIGAEAGERALPVVVTGGAAAWVLQPPLFAERDVLHEPELVHLGMLHAALDSAPEFASSSSVERVERRASEGA